MTFPIRWMGKRSPQTYSPSSSWYLILDLAEDGLSALLVNAAQQTMHPMYWTNVSSRLEASKQFRLPAAVYLSMAARGGQSDPIPLAIGDRAYTLADLNPNSVPETSGSRRMLLHHLKPALLRQHWRLKEASEATAHERSPLPAEQSDILHLALQVLLSTLSSFRGEVVAPATLQCGAEGLTAGTVQMALRQLTGVVCAVPPAVPFYGRSLVEAILQTKLLTEPQRIGFVNEAIALAQTEAKAQYQTTHTAIAPVVIFSWGAVSADWTCLRPDGAWVSEVYLYGVQALQQDLLVDLVARWATVAEPLAIRMDSDPALDPVLLLEIPPVNSPAELWQQLGLAPTDLPQPTQRDLSQRDRLQAALDRSGLGRSLQTMTKNLLAQLETSETCYVQWGEQGVAVKRSHLEQTLLWPMLNQWDKHPPRLMERIGLPPDTVPQMLLARPSPCGVAIARWLQERFPSAQIRHHQSHPHYSSACASGAAQLLIQQMTVPAGE